MVINSSLTYVFLAVLLLLGVLFLSGVLLAWVVSPRGPDLHSGAPRLRTPAATSLPLEQDLDYIVCSPFFESDAHACRNCPWYVQLVHPFSIIKVYLSLVTWRVYVPMSDCPDHGDFGQWIGDKGVLLLPVGSVDVFMASCSHLCVSWQHCNLCFPVGFPHLTENFKDCEHRVLGLTWWGSAALIFDFPASFQMSFKMVALVPIQGNSWF